LIRWKVHQYKYGERKMRSPCNAAVKTIVTPRTLNKFRVVWVYPVDITMAEGMFAQPLIRAYLTKHRNPYAIWYKWHKGDMHHINVQLKGNTTWMGLDYSSFDVNVPSWLIRDAFWILRQQLDFSHYELYGTPTDSTSLPKLWNQIVEYFIHTPIKCRDGKIRVKHNGVPSGSYFTNLIDSVCNSIMTHFILLKLGVKYYEHYFMGDDSLIRVQPDVNLEEVSTLAEKYFGAKINPAKSEIGKYVHWLGYKLGPQYPVVDIEKAIAQLLLPSKPDRYETDILVRAKAIFISSFCDPTLREILENQGLLTNIDRKYRTDVIDRLEYLDLPFDTLDVRLLV
jgi:hypothetical protein